MKRFSIVATLAATLLSGCYESEKSCYERLREDFEDSLAFARSEHCSDAKACNDYARTAAESKARIFLVWMDDDQSACDYYSDGPRLARKR